MNLTKRGLLVEPEIALCAPPRWSSSSPRAARRHAPRHRLRRRRRDAADQDRSTAMAKGQLRSSRWPLPDPFPACRDSRGKNNVARSVFPAPAAGRIAIGAR